MLRNNEKVAISRIKGFFTNILTNGKYIDGQATFCSRIARTSNKIKTSNPLFLLIKVERVPPIGAGFGVVPFF
jgi:hypothetical protein